jgi:hypothetical protein
MVGVREGKRGNVLGMIEAPRVNSISRSEWKQ